MRFQLIFGPLGPRSRPFTGRFVFFPRRQVLAQMEARMTHFVTLTIPSPRTNHSLRPHHVASLCYYYYYTTTTTTILLVLGSSIRTKASPCYESQRKKVTTAGTGWADLLDEVWIRQFLYIFSNYSSGGFITILDISRNLFKTIASHILFYTDRTESLGLNDLLYVNVTPSWMLN
jgi:hypothetical protein